MKLNDDSVTSVFGTWCNTQRMNCIIYFLLYHFHVVQSWRNCKIQNCLHQRYIIQYMYLCNCCTCKQELIELTEHATCISTVQASKLKHCQHLLLLVTCQIIMALTETFTQYWVIHGRLYRSHACIINRQGFMADSDQCSISIASTPKRYCLAQVTRVIIPRWVEPKRHTVVGLRVCMCVSVRRTLTKHQRARCKKLQYSCNTVKY